MQVLYSRLFLCSLVVLFLLVNEITCTDTHSWQFVNKDDLCCFANGSFPPARTHQIGSNPSFAAITLTLPYSIHGNRLENFVDVWHNAWPSLEIHPHWGIETDIRGLGHTLSTIQMLELGYSLGADVILFLEDDAVPFKDDTIQEEILNMLPHWDPHSPIVFLGGQEIRASEKYNLETGLTRLTELLSTFAYMIRREHLLCLAAHVRLYAETKRARYATDRFWWTKVFPSFSTAPYIATPLAVDHKSAGWSSTFNQKRIPTTWEGKRDWWKVWRSKNKF